jgi:hypothetical protein
MKTDTKLLVQTRGRKLNQLSKIKMEMNWFAKLVKADDGNNDNVTSLKSTDFQVCNTV